MKISMLMRWNNQDKYFILICKLSFLQAFEGENSKIKYNYQNNLDLFYCKTLVDAY